MNSNSAIRWRYNVICQWTMKVQCKWTATLRYNEGTMSNVNEQQPCGTMSYNKNCHYSVDYPRRTIVLPKWTQGRFTWESHHFLGSEMNLYSYAIGWLNNWLPGWLGPIMELFWKIRIGYGRFFKCLKCAIWVYVEKYLSIAILLISPRLMKWNSIRPFSNWLQHLFPKMVLRNFENVRQSVNPSVYQSVSPSVRQYVSPSVCQSVSPSVRTFKVGMFTSFRIKFFRIYFYLFLLNLISNLE